MKSVLFATSAFLFSQLAFGQTKSISAFTSLKVYDKIPVELVSSSAYKAEISGSKSDNIEFVNSGKELKVRMKTMQLMQGDDVKVIIHYKNIDNIQASQGSKITSQDEVKATKLQVTSNEGSIVDLDVNTNVLEAKSNTGGIIKLSGKTNSQSVVVNTGGQYDAKDLKSKITTITTNAGGQAAVNASHSIDAKTRAGGVIDVYGDPKTRNDKKVIGGKINYH